MPGLTSSVLDAVGTGSRRDGAFHQQVVVEVPPGDLRLRLRIAAERDAHRLGIPNALGPGLDAMFSLQPVDEGEQVVAVLRQLARPRRST